MVLHNIANTNDIWMQIFKYLNVNSFSKFLALPDSITLMHLHDNLSIGLNLLCKVAFRN